MLIAITSSCATKKSFKIRSLQKGSNYSIFYKHNSPYIIGGKSSLKFALKNLKRHFSDYQHGDPVSIVVSKEGYHPQTIHIIPTVMNYNYVQVELKKVEDPFKPEIMDDLVQSLFEVQRRIKYKDFNYVINKLNELEKKYPNVSTVYELRASAYYLKRDYVKAYSDFKLAWKYNQNNIEAKRMVKLLQLKIAGKS